jgi:hypothetical protein
MTAHVDTADPSDDFATQARDALRIACTHAGLCAADARLIRLYASAVYHLPNDEAVARIAPATTPASIRRRETSIRVTRWLADLGFPTVEALDCDQPVVTSGCVVTFWRYLPQDGPPLRPADLGYLLRGLHALHAPPVPLTVYKPLASVRLAIIGSRALHAVDRRWLLDRCDELTAAYARLTFVLPHGLIHGDAYRGNLLHRGAGAVLADWDSVSNGPRELDLIPTMQAHRFGLPRAEQDAFVEAYGYDPTQWDGYPVLHDIRELHTLTALLRNAHVDARAHVELEHRLTSLKSGDDRGWHAF